MIVAAFTPRMVVKLAAIQARAAHVPDDIEADVILWEHTAFPVCGVAEWVRQLCAFRWQVSAPQPGMFQP